MNQRVCVFCRVVGGQEPISPLALRLSKGEGTEHA